MVTEPLERETRPNLRQPAFLHTRDMAEPRIPLRMNRLCCPVCKEALRDPATTPCGHNFCMQCVRDRWDRDERDNRSCSCPECGEVFPDRPQLTQNTTLADLVSDRERMRHRAPKRPRACTETGTSGSALCPRHCSVLDVYCCTDEQIICAVCASAEHRGHTIGSVTGEWQRKRKELRNIQVKSNRALQKEEKRLKNVGEVLAQIQEEVKNTQDYCESVLVGIIDSLQRHYLKLRELIEAQGEKAAAQVQISQQTVQVKMEEMRKRSAELNHLAQTDNEANFLQKWPSLRRLCERDHLTLFQEASKDPLLPFEFIKRDVEQLGKQLVEFCDKEFASVSQTADSDEQQESRGEEEEDDMPQRDEAGSLQAHGFPEVNVTVPEHNVDPKTRAEFLKYACDLSLDPTTAHKDLAISEGDKEVRLSPQKCKSPASCYPQRFIHRRQVLCREGLQAERCYYEIEVHGDKVEIALAYKGIDRKSRTTLSAFGANANSWSLDRSTQYSVSHRGDSIQLTSTPSHHRIGVYLKFTEGTLMFYEVSDSMNFLYKVQAEFIEPLYPGFWLGEKCCIRICNLR